MSEYEEYIRKYGSVIGMPEKVYREYWEGIYKKEALEREKSYYQKLTQTHVLIGGVYYPKEYYEKYGATDVSKLPIGEAYGEIIYKPKTTTAKTTTTKSLSTIDMTKTQITQPEITKTTEAITKPSYEKDVKDIMPVQAPSFQQFDLSGLINTLIPIIFIAVIFIIMGAVL